MKKKCVIIGSGLGGLSCGVILSKNGYHVTILEQGAQLGGCLQCFHRKDGVFETGMHYIGSADRGQTLYRLMAYLGLTDDIKLSRLDPTGYDVISLQGQHFKFANGKEPFIETLSSQIPGTEDDLNKYYDLVQEVASASSLHTLNYEKCDAAIGTKYQTISINDVIDSTIKNPLLREVLVGNLPLYAAQKDKTPFSTHAFIMDFYNQSAFRIEGGSDNICKSLVKTIKSLGGEIHPNSKVTSIICNDKEAAGVVVNDSKLVMANYIISAIHPASTISMLDTPLIRPVFIQRVKNLRNTMSGFSLYLHFKKNAVPYMNNNFYGYRQNTVWGCEDYDVDTWPKGYLYMHMCNKQNQQYADTGVILSYMKMADVLPWENTRTGHRGLDYEEFKQERAEKLITAVSADFPDLRDKIEAFYTSTPLTYRDYVGAPGGTMYGIAKDVTTGSASRIPHKTKIPNLFLAGQNINSHGMLGVLVGTIVTCSEFIGMKKIFDQIREACE